MKVQWQTECALEITDRHASRSGRFQGQIQKDIGTPRWFVDTPHVELMSNYKGKVALRLHLQCWIISHQQLRRYAVSVGSIHPIKFSSGAKYLKGILLDHINQYDKTLHCSYSAREQFLQIPSLKDILPPVRKAKTIRISFKNWIDIALTTEYIGRGIPASRSDGGLTMNSIPLKRPTPLLDNELTCLFIQRFWC